MIRNVLCASDGSDAAERAVDFAVAFSRGMRVPLTFLSVFPPEGARDGDLAYWGAMAIDPDQLRPGGALDRARRKALAAGLDQQVHYVKAFGKDPAQAIADYALHNNYNHIIVGNIGRSALARFLTGSVAVELPKLAHCTVTIVRA